MRAFAGRRQRAHVADRAAARERTTRGREPDELRDPAHGLILDLRRGAGVDRQIDVVGVGQEVGEGPDLEPARTDEREVARPRLRDRLVEDPRGVVERLVRQGSGPTAGAASRSRRTRSSSGGSSGRNRSKLRQASATSRDRVLERLFARRIEPQRPVGLRHDADGTQNSGSPDILRMEVAEHLARGRPSAHHHRDDRPITSQTEREPWRQDGRARLLVEGAEDRRSGERDPDDRGDRTPRPCCRGLTARGRRRPTSAGRRRRARTRRRSRPRRRSRSSAGAPGRANRSSQNSFRAMNPAMTMIISTIAPFGVPYLFDTEARPRGRRRSRAMANTPRVEAVAAPTPTARMSRNTTITRRSRMNVDPYPPAASGEPSANSGALQPRRMMIVHVEPEARHLRVRRDQVEERHDARRTSARPWGSARFGSAVSSARFAAVSNPTKINTP